MEIYALINKEPGNWFRDCYTLTKIRNAFTRRYGVEPISRKLGRSNYKLLQIDLNAVTIQEIPFKEWKSGNVFPIKPTLYSFREKSPHYFVTLISYLENGKQTIMGLGYHSEWNKKKTFRLVQLIEKDTDNPVVTTSLIDFPT